MINKVYKGKELMDEMHKYFIENGFIQLQTFLNEAHKAKQELNKADFQRIYLPEIESKQTLELKDTYSLEIIKLIEFFKSKEFIEYIEDVIDMDLELKSLSLNKYGHKDYILLNDQKANSEHIEIIFDLTEDWSIEYGGKLVYTTRIEELIYLEPLNNALTIIYNSNEVMKYLKYINNKAKNNEILRIEMEFNIVDL